MPIRRLDAHLAELIAAGEVVERPASVVKELVENALDAGAQHIAVEIERGGIALIRVTDDGCGIPAADLPLVFERHATSKISSERDLDGILTLGFRGEAMASVASVARMELATKHDADEDAHVYRIAGGAAQGVEVAARPRGATVTVRDLFYNTPARMKFLKKDASEGTFVGEAMTRLALSHPEVSFRFARDGKDVFHTPGGGDLRAACHAALGAPFARALLDVADGQGNYSVRGLATPPEGARQSRAMQYFYVNGRFVKNRTMMAALEQAYRGTLMRGKFPGCVLFLSMPAELVDVNVHPAKTEVRFAHENEVFEAVYRAVKSALFSGEPAHRHLALKPEQTGMALPGDAPPAEQTMLSAPGPGANAQPAAPTRAAGAQPREARPAATTAAEVAAYNKMVRDLSGGVLRSDAGALPYETSAARGQSLPPWAHVMPGAAPQKQPGAREEELLGVTDVVTRVDSFAAVEPVAEVAADDTAGGRVQVPPAAPLQNFRVLGELFATYIVAEWEDKLCLIDKHAAHERLLYEQFAGAARDGASQQLLSAVTVRLSPEEKDALLQNLPALALVGIEAEDFGGAEVLVRGVPADIGTDDVEGFVEEVAGRFLKGAKEAGTEKRDWVLHSMACRAAVKGGDKTPREALVRLAADILAGTVPPFCPHGRPVVLELTKGELEKQFGRLG